MFVPPEACDDEVRARVAVVGSGPAGLALSLRLADEGIDVALLESGCERPDPFADALGKASELPPLHAELGGRGARRFGGASWLWGGRCVAYDEVDFTPRPQAEAPGWPISRADIMREDRAAAAFLGIGQPAFVTTVPERLADTSVQGVLERWCAQPRLVQVHQLKLKRSDSISVRLGLTCVGADISDAGRVRSLAARSASGKPVKVYADAYVLAAGGIETARLLLWFLDNRSRPSWLGRGYMGHLHGKIADLVFAGDADSALDYQRLEHCFVRRRLVFAAETQAVERLLNIAFHIDNPSIGDWRHGLPGLSLLALGLKTPLIGARLAPGPMREVLLDAEMEPGGSGRHLVNVLRRPMSALGFATRALPGRLLTPVRPGIVERNPAHRYAIRFSAEQLARFESKVVLSDVKDALGLPRASVASVIGGFDVDSVLRAHDLLDTELRRANVGQLNYYARPGGREDLVLSGSVGGYHQIGAARMGDDPRTSVVDRNARLHGMDNLYVAGSAVFPTSGHANPTFTIVCQALRLASHLADRLGAARAPEIISSEATA